MSATVTILIVEDNAILAKSVARRLRQIGFGTEIAENAAAFSASYARQRYQAVCLDLQLPDGNGLDLLEHIRSLKDNVPVILMTGTGTQEDRARAERQGAVGFLIKPFALTSLIQIVERHVAKPLNAGAC